MAWIEETIPLLRSLVGDDESPYEFCKERLTNILVSSAKLVITEVSFDTTYTVTITTNTVSPDPSDNSTFMVLAALKAAYIVANSEYRASAAGNVLITDGPSTINLSSRAATYAARAKSLLADYVQAKMQHALGNTVGVACISTPTTTPNSDYITNTRRYNRDNY